jgi:hypothetical protein
LTKKQNMTTLTIQATATFVFDDINYYLNQKKLSPEELKEHLINSLTNGEVRLSSGFVSATTKNFQIIS